MIGMDRRTGRTLSGWEQFVSRAAQVMTTQLGSRERRRLFGSRVPELLGKITNDDLLLLAQAYAIAAFYEPINGLTDYKVTRCVASRHEAGVLLRFAGIWQNTPRNFEVSV
uniref:Putative baseplate protein n=1 Tax=viral metagenome TaxID=1070528 RepID=A0A6M3J584_9ZZZZ